MPEHESWMSEALELAARGRGWVSPNPMVGAIVVQNEQAVGRGWHRQFGGPHAEIFALEEAGEAARGATLYCTLEPCNHTGKTPPCTQAILKAGVRTVVVGARDPNPAAAGGCELLRKNGVEVVTGISEEPCKRLNAGFFKALRTGLPLVSLKWAMTLDGKIASRTGDSKWITGEAARLRAHRLRAEHDAVLIGIKTLLADGSRLNCRLPDDLSTPPVRPPRRVILDTQARTPLDSPLWSAEGGGPVVIFCAQNAPGDRQEALAQKGAIVVPLVDSSAGLPLIEVLRNLKAQGMLSVLVEGGSGVLGAFADAKLADFAYAFVAPKLLGGRASLPAVGGEGCERIADCLHLLNFTAEQIETDVLLSGRLGEWEWLK